MNLLKFIRVTCQFVLPKRAVRFLAYCYGFLRARNVTYSQKGEDIIIANYFAQRRIKNGVYLDIGCFHPVWISNTHIFHKAGWRGYCVDIDEFKLWGMKFARKDRVACLYGAVCGACETDATAPVYKFDSKTRLYSDIDTLDHRVALRQKKKGAGDFYIEEIPLIDINRLLADLPHVNFLNLDIEGLDSEVIQAIDFDIFRPDVLLFEDNENWGGKAHIRSRLEQYDYVHLFTSGGSVCFVQKLEIN